jgi:hypothetical protein
MLVRMRNRLGAAGALGVIAAVVWGCGGSKFTTPAGDGGTTSNNDGSAVSDAPPPMEAAVEDAGPVDASGGPCPGAAPGNGSPCAREGLECEYGAGLVPGCDTVGTCDSGRWTVQAPASGAECPSTRPSGCPGSFATASLAGHCEPLGLICDYPTGRCACTDGTGPVALDASAAARWHCQEPGANCPRPRPPLGSACTSDGESCDYGSCTVPGGSGAACADGLWTTMPFACAL